MQDFVNISEANFRAFTHSNKTSEIIRKKQEIMDSLAEFHNLMPTSILFVGFSSLIFSVKTADIYVTDITPEIADYLTAQKVQFTHVARSDLENHHKHFQVTMVVDEYFTYAASDQAQRDRVNEICSLTTEYVITTLRDYKNQDYRDREFSQPTNVRSPSGSLLFLEAHETNSTDRARWTSRLYQINTQDDSMIKYGPDQRRTMYFKQLAKFSMDAGATEFLVHKNLMYKGLIRKNYEHVITIKFE